MKSFTFAAVAAAILSTASAATVKITETPCLQNNTVLETFDVEVGPLVVKSLQSVCGLHIVSASGVDVTTVTCQAFKDAAGTSPGSALFTSSQDARIATNPVQEGSIRCTAAGAPSVAGTVTPMASSTMAGASPSGAGANATATLKTVSTPTLTATGVSSKGSSAAVSTGGAVLKTSSFGAVALGLMAYML